MAPPIATERLLLVPGTQALLEAELQGHEALAQTLEATVPQSWPPDLYDHVAIRWTLDGIAADPDHEEWGFYYFLVPPEESASKPTAVGAGGYKGPPSDGEVEIGYSVLTEHRRRGFATEAVGGLLRKAFADPRVRVVTAETLPELEPSIGVLLKAGFTPTGPGSEPGVIRFERPPNLNDPPAD